MSVNEEAAECRDRRYWTDAFSVASSGDDALATTGPPLFADVMKTALAAGTEISLLKLCQPKVGCASCDCNLIKVR